jgi:hypothetical protein
MSYESMLAMKDSWMNDKSIYEVSFEKFQRFADMRLYGGKSAKEYLVGIHVYRMLIQESKTNELVRFMSDDLHYKGIQVTLDISKENHQITIVS